SDASQEGKIDRTEIANASAIIAKILKSTNYDKNARPKAGSKQCDEKETEFTVSMFLRQEWYDFRLVHEEHGTLPLRGTDLDKIWRPDTYFTNNNDYKLYEDNQLALISKNGYVYYSARLFVVASCPMYLKKFPTDVQECSLVMESYGEPVKILNMELAEFDLTKTTYTYKDVEYVAGKYRDMIVTFTFSRRIGYYLINFYAPCIIMVIMSWISFWIDRDCIGDRIALGITTVLTIVFLLGSSNSTMPRVSYPKAIDWYLMTSFIFVFVTLLMCLLIFRFDRQLKRQQPTRSVSYDAQNDAATLQMPEETAEARRVSYYVADSQGAVYPIVRSVSGLKRRNILKQGFPKSLCGMPLNVTRDNLGMVLNNFCRVLFPTAFVFFNLIYWLAIA
ncbi:Glycine receptor subunit alpha-3, partial [Acropora cervicornis]